jgi:hypothetical protein
MKLKLLKKISHYITKEMQYRYFTGNDCDVIFKEQENADLNEQLEVKKLLKITPVIKIDCSIVLTPPSNISKWIPYEENMSLYLQKLILLFYLRVQKTRGNFILEFYYKNKIITPVYPDNEIPKP